jgi:predicted ATPase
MNIKFELSSNKSSEFGSNVNQHLYNIFDSDKNKDETVFECLKNLSTINLFVGANNSGKSRFLRGFFKTSYRNYSISSSNTNVNELAKRVIDYYNSKINNVANADHTVGKKMQDLFSGLKLSEDYYSFIIDNYSSVEKIFLKAEELYLTDKKELEVISSSSNSYYRAVKIRFIFLEYIFGLKAESDFIAKNCGRYKIYIPILRSIKRSNDIDPKSFSNTIKHLYDFKEVKDDDIITGLDLYDKVLRIRNDVKEHRRGFEKFEKFLSKYFFNQEEVEIISSLDKNQHLIFYVGGEERKIHDIGDGVQSIILLMFSIFTANNNTWVFIEEPETYLHPGLQRIFLETLLEDDFLKTKNLHYFFSTHSNHFLDLTLTNKNICILQFDKIDSNKFEIKVDVKPNQEILNLLGVNTSSVFLANTSLWVEGPTDRKYLSFFLKKYCESKKVQFLKEDIDFAFFEYGGNLIAHYLFEDEKFEANEEVVRDKISSFALSNKIYLLADEDGAKGNTKKGKRRKALQELSDKSNDFKYQNTELREIENLLPLNIVKSFIIELLKASQTISAEKIDFKKDDYDKIGLGEFYENQFKQLGVSAKHQNSYKADSGTLKNDYKIKLCDFTINSNITYDEIIDNNPILDRIITGLYSFIEK